MTMRVKLDENIPVEAGAALASLGHDSDSVFDEHLTGESDERVSAAARAAGRVLITQDLDFSDLRSLASPLPGILLLRLHDPNRRALIRRISGIFASGIVESWAGKLVVASDHKIRIRDLRT